MTEVNIALHVLAFVAFEGEPPGEPISQGARTEPRPPRITEAHSGREAHQRAGSELGGVDDSVGSGDGLDDRLERADLIDFDGVERHGDLMNGTGEIDENARTKPISMKPWASWRHKYGMYVPSTVAWDARRDAPFNCPDGVENHDDERIGHCPIWWLLVIS